MAKRQKGVIVASKVVTRNSDYLYFVDGEGNVRRSPRKNSKKRTSKK